MRPSSEHRRLEDLLAPLALLVVVGLVVGFLVLRPGSEDSSTTAREESTGSVPASASASASASPSPSPSPSTTTPGAASGAGERDRLPGPIEPLASDLPAPSCPEPQPPVRLSVLDLNTVAAPTRDTYDLDLLVAELRAWDADVMVLQEVARPDALARRLGLEVAHDDRSGATVLSSYRVDASGTARLPGRRGAPAGVLGVRIDVAGEPVDVYSSRITGEDAALRLAQTESLREIATAHEVPTLLGGDLGAGPSSASVRALARAPMTDAWAQVASGPGATVPANAPRSRHDYLFADDAFEPLDAELLRSQVASHLALRVTYDVTTTPACLPPGSMN